MKKFLIKLALFAFPAVVLLAVLTRIAYVTELSILESDLTLPTNVVAAVVGDSRVAEYFDPAEIPWLRNYGLRGSPFQITAEKARMIVELNPNLELLVIDIWPSKFLETNHPFGSSAPYGVSLLELKKRKDMPPLGDDFPMRLGIELLRPGLRHALKREGASSQIAGDFWEYKHYLADDIAKGMQWPPSATPMELQKTPTAGEIVLEHLLDELTGKGVNIVLTTTPLEKRWTPDAREYFERRMGEISRKYNVPWFNWMHEYQDNIDYWADGIHLNADGAKVFSRDKGPVLKQCMTRGVLETLPARRQSAI